MMTYFFLSMLTLAWAAMFILPLTAYVALGIRSVRSALHAQGLARREQPIYREHALSLAAS